MTVLVEIPPAPVTGWHHLCRVEDLYVERGSAALINGHQIALFRLHDGRLYATAQQDPYSGAFVLSRGIVGDRGGAPTVTSPMYKQVYDLRTGVCLDTQGRQDHTLATYPLAVADGIVSVKWEAR